jgi:deoxyribodipyrimidine photolyase-related protein
MMRKRSACKTLRLVLGDQLTHWLASLREADPQTDVICLFEVWEEATYVPHHPKKIAFLFAAMRHFATELEAKGFQVHYTRLDCPENTGSFFGELQKAVESYRPERIDLTFPGEYRVWEAMNQWGSHFEVPVTIQDDDRFLCSLENFQQWAKGRKSLRMELFYREMRQQHQVLMNESEPEGGQWNYDAENRKFPKGSLRIPGPTTFEPDKITQEVLRLVKQRFSTHFGDLEPFSFAVTRDQALVVLNEFLEQRLPFFGDYQDAMLSGEPWLYHSHLSFYLNAGLLVPLEVIQAAQAQYHQGKVPLNAVEGFIRQILGWREYVRGLYWLKMPDYKMSNALNATRSLPALYWGAETPLNCLSQCVQETKANAYAHHIQRLMVLGNFALLIGANPHDVHQWYLAVYADAYEWVELPNVLGMILFADGGYLASKPYASGGAYINRMSDYCKGCHYDVKLKTGPKACPFNYLYWSFLMQHQERFKSNARLGMIYGTLAKFSEAQRQEIREDADRFLSQLD